MKPLHSTNTITISPAPAERIPQRVSRPAVDTQFTRTGDAALEAHLAMVCEEVGKGVRGLVPAALLEGVLLGGGYGRGEGGVLSTKSGDAPYNDMEFYVFLRGSTILNDRRYKHALHHLGESLSEMAGLEVEFKILSLAGLRRSAVTMFSYDFVMGHRWVIGDDSLLAGCDHHRDAASIPQHEATRLLFNRCTGLLYAKARLLQAEFTADDADYVARNLAKVRLALGDSLLASLGLYHWSCQERHERLLQLPRKVGVDLSLLQKIHAAGVKFKLHPERSTLSRETLALQHLRLCDVAANLWLLIESKRLGHSFVSLDNYRTSGIDKCPEQPGWRNRLVNARRSGLKALFDPASVRYPRERLFHALTVLLWSDTTDPANLHAAQAELRSAEFSFTSLVSSYQQLWSHFN